MNNVLADFPDNVQDVVAQVVHDPEIVTGHSTF